MPSLMGHRVHVRNIQSLKSCIRCDVSAQTSSFSLTCISRCIHNFSRYMGLTGTYHRTYVCLTPLCIQYASSMHPMHPVCIKCDHCVIRLHSSSSTPALPSNQMLLPSRAIFKTFACTRSNLAAWLKNHFRHRKNHRQRRGLGLWLWLWLWLWLGLGLGLGN